MSCEMVLLLPGNKCEFAPSADGRVPSSPTSCFSIFILTPVNLDPILYATVILNESVGLLATHVLMPSDAGVTVSTL